VFRNVSTYNSEAGESSKGKNATFTIRGKFDINKCLFTFRTTQLVKDWGESVSELMIVKKTITRNCTQYCLAWVFLPFVHVVKF